MPGRGEVIASAFDPAPSGNVRTGGVIWLSNFVTTPPYGYGERTRSYQLYVEDQPATFGKAAGIGDIEALCEAAPIQIGNRVWRDSNGNGVQDPGEAPIRDVTVTLLDRDGNPVPGAVVVTNDDGAYYFSSATGTNTTFAKYGLPLQRVSNYQVRIALEQPALAGLLPTTDNAAADNRDSDGIVAGTNVVVDLTTGGAGNNDHTFDFGFVPGYSLGNRVWLDNGAGGGTPDDGVINGAEPGIGEVRVELLDGDGNPVLGLDGNPRFDVTDGNGYYRFDGLAEGDYIVAIAAANFAPTGPLSSARSSTPTSSGIDKQDNGINDQNPAANGIRSAVVTLGPGDNQPVNDDEDGPGDNAPPAALDNRGTMTIDFGFVAPAYSLGNRVWYDTNNDQIDNDGPSGGPGAGIDGVTLDLFAWVDASSDDSVQPGELTRVATQRPAMAATTCSHSGPTRPARAAACLFLLEPMLLASARPTSPPVARWLASPAAARPEMPLATGWPRPIRLTRTTIPTGTITAPGSPPRSASVGSSTRTACLASRSASAPTNPPARSRTVRPATRTQSTVRRTARRSPTPIAT